MNQVICGDLQITIHEIAGGCLMVKALDLKDYYFVGFVFTTLYTYYQFLWDQSIRDSF